MSQTHRDSHSQSQTSPQHPSGSPGGYSFDVFRPSSSGLVHASSSSRSQGILRSTRADAGKKHASLSYEEDDDQENDTSSKRYVCQHCGKRFGRPSSLKTHEIVHSDDKPYECTYPGCGKTFTVPSNMRRHYRKTHEAPSGRNSGSGEDEDYPQESAPSSSGKTYYTSSRR
ncbi:hypothetical protein K439DRAFT_1334234 [Ramaria rubella]|nr:hypothetical protein K439DRAFT_1334234 [Ramaria rubella]